MIDLDIPSPDLGRKIETWWSLTKEGPSGRAFYEVYPDSNVDLVFRFSSSCCRMVLLGPATEKACIEIDHESDYMGLRFRAGQVPVLADVHPYDLIDGRIELTHFMGIRIDSLADQIHALPDLASRRLVMEDQLRRARPLIRDKRCRQAALLLEAHGGQLKIGELASMLGLNIRSLERLFAEHFGMSPKRLSRFVRLRRLLSMLRTGAFENMAQTAFVCGYTDQSHMIKDFRDMTGHLPGEISLGHTGRLAEKPNTGIVHRYRQ